MALILASVAVLSLLGPVRAMLAGTGKTRLQGNWKQVWTYQNADETVQVEEELRVRQLGRVLRGSARSLQVTGPAPFRSVEQSFEANIVGVGVIEGKWRNTNEGRNYQGVFTGVVSASGQ